MGVRAILLSCAALLGPLAAAGEYEVRFTVTESVGVERKSEPVSGGIPLPLGRFKNDQSFALFDGAREVPLQVSPLVVQPDGTLRWILLDFQADFGPNERKTFTLKAGQSRAKPPVALKVSQTADAVAIETGRVTLTLSKNKPFGLFDSVQVGGKKVAGGGEASYVDDFDGKRYVADKPTSVAVEYAGAMRTTVAVKGRFVGDDQTKLLYVARVTAWAGRSDVHVKYSLCNSNPDHYCFRRIKDSTVTLKLGGRPDSTVIGAARPLDAAGEAWMHQSSRVVSAAIHSHDNFGNCPWLRKTPGASGPGGSKAGSGGKVLWTSQGKNDVSEGWITVRLSPPQAAKANGATIWVTDLYFVEDPPRRLAVKDGALLLTGITEPLEGAQPPFPVKARWLFDCSHLSSQYVLDFAPPTEPAALSAQAKRTRARMWATAPAAWYFTTEGLPVGKFGTQGDELKCYDTWGWKYDKSKAPRSPVGQIARINRWTAGDDNHFVSEQDTLDGLILMYLRTGSRAFLDVAEPWANYFLDLQTWRTDGWRFKDGGVWWHGGPVGNRPQRAADPVTGVRNRLPAEWTKSFKAKPEDWDRATCNNISYLFLAKACKCHNWGEGLTEWFCLTGDRDAYEAAIDTVEQNIDAHRRAFRRAPGKPGGYSRDFTRASYLTHATRLMAPADPFVVEASDFLAEVYLTRTNPEPRGLVNAAGKVRGGLSEKNLKKLVGEQGIAEMKRLGITVNAKTGELTDPKTGARWYPVSGPATWMFPPLSRAMGLYYRITGNEDAHDWLIAYGQAVARVLFQPKHGNLSASFLADFPRKGVAKDSASWVLPEDSKNGEGVRISGYLACFHPDVAARAYALCGEPFLKQRAYDYWFYGSHRGYGADKMHNVGGVGAWVNVISTHKERVCYTGRTFYEWSHPRRDEKPPGRVTNLTVRVRGKEATVRFTAPADEGGGKVVRYQVKCSDKPIVGYEEFLKAWADNTDSKVTNWWMAANLRGEPAPKAPKNRESFTVTGVGEGARYFAVRSFDDSSNRSAMSSPAEAGK